jgi:ferrous iron transport protein A
MSSLDQLGIGEKAVVINVNSSMLCAKMAEMGMVEGVEIRIAFKAPFGDPIAIELNGTLLSLRKKEAAQVMISKLNV